MAQQRKTKARSKVNPKDLAFDTESAKKVALSQGITNEEGEKLGSNDVLFATEDFMFFHSKDLDTAKVHAKHNDLKMIRIVFTLLLLGMFTMSASAQYHVNWPFAAADVEDLTDSDSVTLQPENAFTIIQADTGSISQNITELNIEADTELPTGSILMLLIEQGSTARNVALGDEYDTVHGPNLTGVANDKDLLILYWTGSVWVAVTAAWQKILDAA